MFRFGIKPFNCWIRNYSNFGQKKIVPLFKDVVNSSKTTMNLNTKGKNVPYKLACRLFANPVFHEDMSSVKTFSFSVKGQKGKIPQIGLGTAGLGEKCESSVMTALNEGYRHIDTALLYGNHVPVGKGIQKSSVPRNQIFVTSKVAFFPNNSEGVWMYNSENLKGSESSSIDLSLKQLGLDYVELFLVHNPCTGVAEYNSSCLPHFFELGQLIFPGMDMAITPSALMDGDLIRPLIMSAKREKAMAARNPSASFEARRQTWAAMERAKHEGKCRFIGVSNYPAELLLEMKEYAEIMPAVNQLEFHPRYASPELQRVAKELGVVLTGYGTGYSVKLDKNKTIASIATKIGKTPTQVVLRWTVQSGVVVIPRSGSKAHIQENLDIFDWKLSPADMESINGLNEDHPYYWDPVPCVNTLRKLDAKL